MKSSRGSTLSRRKLLTALAAISPALLAAELTLLPYILPRFPLLVVYYYIVRLFDAYDNSQNILKAIYVVPFLLAYLLPAVKVVRRNVRSPIPRLLVHLLIVAIVAISLIVLVLALVEVPLALVLLQPIKDEVHGFIEGIELACGNNVSCVVWSVTEYVSRHVNNSYTKPQSVLEIDNLLARSPFDLVVLNILGFTPAHVILWQGWGSCGEYAVVTAYLLHRLGYEVRIVHFTDIDHAWAEVHINNTWYIVDPWYIGKHSAYGVYLTPANELASIPEFAGNHRVECTYDVIWMLEWNDCSSEHGYR